MLNFTNTLLSASMLLIAVSCVPQAQTGTAAQTAKPKDPYATTQQYPPAAPTATTTTPVYPPATPPATTYPAATTTTPTYPAATSSTTSTTGQSYTIQKGDTLYGISRKYGTSIDALRTANAISGDIIHPGQSIVIP